MNEENKTNRTMKIRNITSETHELHRPNQITMDFKPGEVVEVTYSLGQELVWRPQFEEVGAEESKKKKSKKVK